MNLFDYNLSQVFFALLMSVRLGAFFFSIPVLSENKIPPFLLVLLPLALGVLLSPVVPHKIPEDMLAQPAFLFFAIPTEMLTGLLMGFVVKILFSLANIVGDLLGMQAGFSMASFFDPHLGQVTELSYLLRILFGLLFFSLNLHHKFLWMVTQSYQAIPVGMSVLSLAQIIPALFKIFSTIYLLSLHFVLPAMTVILLSHVLMGVISITAPQMNIYFNAAVTINVYIVMGIFVLSLPLLILFFDKGLQPVNDFLSTYFLLR